VDPATDSQFRGQESIGSSIQGCFFDLRRFLRNRPPFSVTRQKREKCSRRLEPTCPGGCRAPVQKPTEAVFVPGNVFDTEELGGNQAIPQGVPTNQTTTDPMIVHRWNVSLMMRLNNGLFNLDDYEYEVSYDQGAAVVTNSVTGRQTPNGGEAFIGTFQIQVRRFGTTETNPDRSISNDRSITATGTITLYGSDGRTATQRFEISVTGNNSPTVTPPAPVNWTRRPSN
jgi:hypothetical protein